MGLVLGAACVFDLGMGVRVEAHLVGAFGRRLRGFGASFGLLPWLIKCSKWSRFRRRERLAAIIRRAGSITLPASFYLL